MRLEPTATCQLLFVSQYDHSINFCKSFSRYLFSFKHIQPLTGHLSVSSIATGKRLNAVVAMRWKSPRGLNYFVLQILTDNLFSYVYMGRHSRYGVL